MSCGSRCEKRSAYRPDGNQCPVYKMADGRHFTDYRPHFELNNTHVNSTNGNYNSYEYRMFLQHNAEKLMDENRGVAYEDNVCKPCYDFNQDGTMLPEKYKTQCTEHSCTFDPNSTNGLGTGRNYNVKSNTPLMNDKEQKVVPQQGFLSFLWGN